MRVACIKDGKVVNVIEVDGLEAVPDIIYANERVVIRKAEAVLLPTEIGSVGDIYIEGEGFYRLIGGNE